MKCVRVHVINQPEQSQDRRFSLQPEPAVKHKQAVDFGVTSAEPLQDCFGCKSEIDTYQTQDD